MYARAEPKGSGGAASAGARGAQVGNDDEEVSRLDGFGQVHIDAGPTSLTSTSTSPSPSRARASAELPAVVTSASHWARAGRRGAARERTPPREPALGHAHGRRANLGLERVNRARVGEGFDHDARDSSRAEPKLSKGS